MTPEPAGQSAAPSPSYHDVFITTAEIPRASIFDLPYGIEVRCTRVGGWQVFMDGRSIASEFDSPAKWLVLDVGGYVIIDTRKEP